jgi:Ribosomal protein L11 methyltransferase (PrmA)
MKLCPHTILQRVPSLNLQIDSSNYVQIVTQERVISCGPRGLAILDAFSQPTALSEALAQLQTQLQGAQDWVDMTGTILQLYRAGILQADAQIEATLRAEDYGFDSAPIHVAMLNDRTRTTRFLAGIHEVVRPGDVVVDIGTGTGVLAVAAVHAGARRVYAVEASSIGESAKAVFEANGLADRITLVPGWSTQLSLPERADVLVTETIGNEPLGERLLELTTDALKRLLKPEARLVPGKIKIFGLPVTIPRAELLKHTFTAEALQNWHSWYNIDFSPLLGVVRHSPHLFYIKPHWTGDWQTLSEPILLADLDLKVTGQFVVDNTTAVIANAAGQLDGVIVYFELELGPTIRLSTHPSQADENCSWRSPVWVFGEPLFLQPGNRFAVTYKYRVPEAQEGVSVARL